MYNLIVLDHLENPRNVGDLADPTAAGEATNPVCGDYLLLQLKIDQVARSIVDVRFKAQGCPPCIAAASLLTEALKGMSLQEAASLTPADMDDRLGALPPNKAHCAIIAIDGLKAALHNFETSIGNG